MYWALTGANVPTLIPKKDEVGLAIPPQKCQTPKELKPQLPAEISELVMQCVKNDPKERPRNMLEIIAIVDKMVHSLLGDKLKNNKDASKNN